MTFFGGSSHRIVKFALVLIISALVLNQVAYKVSNWKSNQDDHLPKQSFYGNNVQNFVDPLAQVILDKVRPKSSMANHNHNRYFYL